MSLEQQGILFALIALCRLSHVQVAAAFGPKLGATAAKVVQNSGCRTKFSEWTWLLLAQEL